MSRRHAAEKRTVNPDARYHSVTISKFINAMMYSGKKGVAEKIFYDALETVRTKTKQDALEVFNSAMANVRPTVEVRSRRVGGATYQVPMEIRPERSLALAMRWLIIAARKRGEKTMDHRLSGELMDAFNNRGNAIKKREDTHKMAEANKAFSHYRW